MPTFTPDTCDHCDEPCTDEFISPEGFTLCDDCMTEEADKYNAEHCH